MVKNKNGFTLIEILLFTGVISLASISVYVIFNSASSWYTSRQEAETLNSAIDKIERAVSSTGLFTGINKNSLDALGGFEPKLNLTDVSSPTPNSLEFSYVNISNDICSKFVTKMVDSRNNLTIKVNNNAVVPSIESITQECSSSNNSVKIILNSSISMVGLAPVVPSPPPAPPAPPPPPPAPVPSPSGPPAPTGLIIPGSYSGTASIVEPCGSTISYPLSAVVNPSGSVTFNVGGWQVVGSGDSAYLAPATGSCTTTLNAAGAGYCNVPMYADNGAYTSYSLGITGSNALTGYASIPGSSCGS